jgi:5'-nucleotidase
MDRPTLRCSPRVYLDLDGVMADFDAHFPAVFGLDHRGMADDDMWRTINAHPSYFRDMPPCRGAIEFFREIEDLNPIILTACPRTNYANAATQKRGWVRQHLSTSATVLPVMGGHNKPLFMHALGDILIDDFEKNTRAWTEAGGISILHRNFEDTRRYLRTAFSVRVPAPSLPKLAERG